MNAATVSLADIINGIMSSEKLMTPRGQTMLAGTTIVIVAIKMANNTQTAAITPATVLLVM